METTQTQQRYMATNLVKILRETGRRSDWVSEQVGLHPSAMSHIARGRRSIDAERAQAIADVLGVELTNIFALAANGDVEEAS
jgi:DNA-binding transcriptional regulator YdaS (Cro superfamily)